jgi:hypothetical protein
MKRLPELPSTSEAQRRDAEVVLGKADEALADIASARKRLVQGQAKLLGARPGERRDKTFWRGVVQYVNAQDLDDSAYTKFSVLLQFCSEPGFSGGFEGASFVDLTLARTQGMTAEQAIQFCCGLYQPKLRTLLSWLCAPDKHKDLSREAIDFLWRNAIGIESKPEINDEADFDAESDTACPIFYWKHTRYKTVMSPICKFILDHVEQYHDGTIDLDEAVPIGQCERPGCGKFFVPERTGKKKFCSQRCCEATQPRRSGKENRDYMRLWRLERMPLPALRVRLKSPERLEWLSQIEKDWPELAERVKALRLRATKK